MEEENNGQQPIQFVLLTQQILNDSRLTTTAKLVLARASGFAVFFESAENTAKFVNVNVRTVKTARRLLEQFGYLEEIANTGRGKKYRVNLTPDCGKPKDKDEEQAPVRGEKTPPQRCKNVTSEVANLHTYNKDKIKLKQSNTSINTSIEQSSADKAVENSEIVKETFGNEDINEVLEAFCKATSSTLSSRQKQQRWSANRLLKKHGKENLLKVIAVVGESISDPYAPRIASVEQLERRWDDLKLWCIKTKAKQASTENVII